MKNNFLKIIAVAILIIAVFLFATFYKKTTQNKNLPVSEKENILLDSNEIGEKFSTTTFDRYYKQSMFGGNDKLMKNYLVATIAKGINDKNAKSAAYWVSHRYFDTSGDIYEIYNYVNENPELSFLKEAENIYPEIFKNIKNGITKKGDHDSLLAILAYLEIFDKYNYSTLPMLSTLSSKYAGLSNVKAFPTSAKIYMQKSKMYFEKAKIDTYKVLENKDLDLLVHDKLVGINQYSSTMQYYKYFGEKYDTKYTPDDVYKFSINYAAKNVPELYFFTKFSAASFLVLNKEATTENITPLLSEISKFDLKNTKLKNPYIIHAIIDSKVLKSNSDIYGYSKIIKMAELDSDFKAWLITNGWTEADFTNK